MPKDFSEKTLELLIMNNLDKVQERGFPTLYEYTVNQFSLPSGKIIDIFSFHIQHNTIFCKVFELKRDQLMLADVLQLLEYATELFVELFPHFMAVSIERYIIGADHSREVTTLMESLPDINFYLYNYGFTGLYFKKSECVLSTDNAEMKTLLKTPTSYSAALLEKILLITGK